MATATLKNKDVSGKKPEVLASKEAPQAHEAPATTPLWKTQKNRVNGVMFKHTQEGDKTRYTIGISRSYKDRKTNKWVSTHYFDPKDMDDVIDVAREAKEKHLELSEMTQNVVED